MEGKKEDLIRKLFKASSENNVDAIREILATDTFKEEKQSILDAKNDQDDGASPLIVTCRSDSSYEAFVRLVEAGCDVNATDDNGDTGLHVALASGAYATYNYLLNNAKRLALNAGKQNHAGETFLHKAVLAKDLKNNLQIMSKDSNLRMTKNKRGLSPFHLAVVNGYVEQAEALIQNDGTIVNQMTENGEIPLWLAIKNHQLEMFKFLLENNADVSIVHKRYGTSVLWLAVDLQQEDAVRLLFERGVETKSIFDFGNDESSPFLLSLVRESEIIRDMIVDKVDARTKILFDLSKAGDLDTIDPNFVDEGGNSILHLAVMSDSRKVVSEIFPICKDKEVANKLGKTAYDVARERNVSDVLNYLDIRDRCANSDTTTCLSNVAELTESFPIFMEEEKEWLNIHPDHLNNVTIGELERHLIQPLNIRWDTWKWNVSDRNNIPSLAQRCLHAIEKGDDPNTLTIKDVLKFIHDIESYLNNQHEAFQHLDVAFFPVGSVVEGTKVGPLNEMDFMTSFGKLNRALMILDETTLAISRETLANLHPNVLFFFDEEGKLKTAKLFTEFVKAIGEAVSSISDLPGNIRVYDYDSVCENDECQHSKYAISSRRQCRHLPNPPCVCITKVGAGLNLVIESINDTERTVFTVDLVLSFQVLLPKAGNSSSILRQRVVKYLMTELPPGWKEHLVTYLSGERVSQEKFDQEHPTISVGTKMIDFTGKFVLRPGIFLDVMHTFENDNIRQAYMVLKLLRHLTSSKVKSYDLKKAIFELKSELGNESNIYLIVKAVLEHKEMQGKFYGIMSQLSRDFSAVDLIDFPTTLNGMQYLHFLHKRAQHLNKAVKEGNRGIITDLNDDAICEEGYSIHGKYPLHWACESPVKPNADIIRFLLEKQCGVDRQDLQGNTPFHMLLCNGLTVRKSLLALLEYSPNSLIENRKGYDPMKTAIHILDEDERACGKYAN